MNKELIVSVIVTTYGHEKYILETLNSIVEQKASFTIEVVIGNDCSPDNTHEIIENFLSNRNDEDRFVFKYYNHSTNLGVSANFDYIYKQATGKYIAFCEGDDYWIDTTKLQQQVDFLENNPEYNLVYTDAQYYKQKTKEFDLQRTQQINGFEDLLIKNRIFTLTVCLKKEVIEAFRKADALDLKDLPFGDYSLWLFASTKGQAKYLPIVSAVYRILEESASHSKDISKLVAFEESVSKCRLYFLNKYYQGDKKEIETKLLGSKARSVIKMSFLYKDEKVFNDYKEELKYIADYKYKYYLIYSLARINFRLFVKMYSYLAK